MSDDLRDDRSLTDRGVEGRDPPKPLDVFLTTERGIYRAGETVYATALIRDASAIASPGIPLSTHTAVGVSSMALSSSASALRPCDLSAAICLSASLFGAGV